jgi:hypothetical protein
MTTSTFHIDSPQDGGGSSSQQRLHAVTPNANIK